MIKKYLLIAFLFSPTNSKAYDTFDFTTGMLHIPNVKVYGSLYYANQPVSLYYKIEQKQAPRSIKLWPIAIEDSKLVISEVKLDENLYSDYQWSTRILNIPAGVGGKFQVTFQRVE